MDTNFHEHMPGAEQRATHAISSGGGPQPLVTRRRNLLRLWLRSGLPVPPRGVRSWGECAARSRGCVRSSRSSSGRRRCWASTAWPSL